VPLVSGEARRGALAPYLHGAPQGFATMNKEEVEEKEEKKREGRKKKGQ